MGHALGSLTFPEFLGKRFNSKFIQSFSGLVIFLIVNFYYFFIIFFNTIK